ncbi:archease [Elusimicrobiota bacterium]
MGVKAAEPGYRVVPHTSEVGIWFGGRTWKSFYENAARGLLAVYGIEGLDGTCGVRARADLRAESPEELLVDWLNEIVYLVSTKRWAPTRVVAVAAGRRLLRARLSGPRLRARDALGVEVKAATYHRLGVRRRGGLWTATVILDV